jgi:hypothetical protein
MKSYVLKSKDEDLSFIPEDSFIYFEGCGFVKHSPFITKWTDVDEKDIVCLKNETMQKLISSPSLNDVFGSSYRSYSDKQVALQSADYIWIVVYGEQNEGKGATITEIDFQDFMGNNVPYDMNNFVDIKLSNDSYWNNTDNWEGDNLYNGDLEYKDEETGKKSSTLFNVGQSEGISSFYIHFKPEIMKTLDTIKLCAGSKEGRIPKAIAVFSVKNKDDKDKRIQTLLFMKTYKKGVDDLFEPKSVQITQTVNMTNPCADLYKRGYTESGIHVVYNSNTKKLEPVYCEFPRTISENDVNLKDLCEENPYSKIIIKKNDNYEYVSIADYLKSKDYICSYDSCDNSVGDEFNICMKKLCVALKRNPQAQVKIIYKDNDEFKTKMVKVSDYILQKKFDCSANEKTIVVNSQDDIIKNINLLKKEDYNKEILFINPANGEKLKITPKEYMEAYDATHNPNDIQKKLNDGWKIKQSNNENNEDEMQDDPCYVTMVKNGEEIKLKKPNCMTTDVYTDDVKDDSKSGIDISKSGLVATDEKATNIEIVDDNNLFQKIPNDISINDINFPSNKIVYKVDVENVEVPVLDEQGNVVIDPITSKPKTKIEQKLKIIFVNMPDDLKKQVIGDKYQKLILTDGNNQVLTNVSFKKPVFTINSSEILFGKFSTPLQKFVSKKYPDGILKVSFEYDEGCLLYYYGAKEEIEIKTDKDIDDKLKIKIEKSEKNKNEGKIIITSIMKATDIVEGFIDLPIIFQSGNTQIKILVRIMKHMRINNSDFKDTSICIDELLVDEIKKIKIFNINHKNPLCLLPNQYFGYRNSYGSGNLKGIKIDIVEGPCYQPGISLKMEKTDVDEISNEERILDVIGVQQTNKKNTKDGYRRFYIIDPIFNQQNMKNQIISPDEIYNVEVKYNVDRLMEINGQKNLFEIDLDIDKYRFYNSETHFNDDFYKREWYRKFRDFKIFYQTNGLNVNIENSDVCGIKIAQNYNGEDMYFDCRFGKPMPLPFRITTLDKNIGKTKIILKDTKSQVVVNVNVYQTIDINYPYNSKKYEILNPYLGTTTEIELLHPYDNEWDKIKSFSDDDKLVETEIIKKDDGKYYLRITYIGIGTTKVYVTDFHKTKVINVKNIQYKDKLTAQYSMYKILKTDKDKHQVQLYNVKGEIDIDYDADKLSVEYDNDKNIISFNNIKEELYSTNINVLEKKDSGNEELKITIKTCSDKNELSSKQQVGLPQLQIDDGTVYFDID